MKKLACSITILCLLICYSATLVVADDSVLKVGVSLPISGPVAAMGEAFRRGFELFEADLLENDRHVTFIFEDHRYDGKTSAGVFHKLREIDKVDFMIVFGNTSSEVCVPLAERYELPLLAVSFEPLAKDRSFVVTFGPKAESLIKKIVEIFHRWELHNPAAVSIDIGNALKGVEQVKGALNGKLLVKKVSNEEVDFKTLIAILRSKQVDGILLFLLPAQATTFLRQAADMKYYPRIIGGDIFAEDDFQKHLDNYPAEVSFVYGSTNKTFVDRIKAHYHETSYFYETASGYALASLLSKLARKAGDKQGLELIAELKQVNPVSPAISDIRLLNDDQYGAHFDVAAALYDKIAKSRNPR